MRKRSLALAVRSICFASSCTFAHAGTASPVMMEGKQVGIASYYSDKFHGRRTANGEHYDKNALTGVHSGLPFGTIIKVTNLHNRRYVHLRINDRKHGHNRRLLDVSRRAAEELGFIGAGVAKVEIEIVHWGDS
ncbi:MAG: septal ring lytic transglycosylase RlpA family protein [Methylococcaceae bacterium]|nr:septal ring lytic transglycosylase RlpA family protein [Methylococcaceae bacterium]